MSNTPGILVVGKLGQLAHAIKSIGSVNLIFKGRDDHDFFDEKATAHLIENYQIRTLINTAAYTAVDLAETEKEAAFHLNQHMPKALATVCSQTGCRLVHVSTDYVFDGNKPIDQAYVPKDATNPINTYGKSKLAGEEAVLAVPSLSAKIIRTSWLHSSFGRNFQTTMERIIKERDEVRVVNDQWGTPTKADDLAVELVSFAQDPSWSDKEIRHVTSQPTMTWFDLACQIKENLQLNTQKLATVTPIPTIEYPTPAKRGKNTSLSMS